MDRANEGLEVWISAKPLMHGRSWEAADSDSVSMKPTTDVPHVTEAPPAAMLFNMIAYSILASKNVYWGSMV